MADYVTNLKVSLDDDVSAKADRIASSLTSLERLNSSGVEHWVRTGAAIADVAKQTSVFGNSAQDAIQQLNAISNVFVQVGQAYTGIEAKTMSLRKATEDGTLAINDFGTVLRNFGLSGTASVFDWVNNFTAGTDAIIKKTYDLQQQLRATRADYQLLTDQIAASALSASLTSSVSKNDATASAKIIVAAPNFNQALTPLDDYIKKANDLSVVLGTSVPDAAKKLVSAIGDTAAAAKQAESNGMVGFTAQLTDQITTMQAAGNRAGALSLYMQALGKDIDAAAKPLPPFEQAMRNFYALFEGRDGSAADGFFHTVQDALQSIGASVVNQLTNIVGAFLRAKDAVASVPGAIHDYFFGSNTVGKPTDAAYGPQVPIQAVPLQNQALSQDNYALIDAAKNVLSAYAYQKNPGNQALNDQQVQTVGNFAGTVMQVESGGNQYDPSNPSRVLTSSRGAMGLMQLMPGTARQYGVDPTNPQQNANGGLQYLYDLYQKYNGDLVKMAIAYNWGPANADLFFAGKANIPAETVKFVQQTTGLTPSQLNDRFAGSVAGTAFNQQISNDAYSSAKTIVSGDLNSRVQANLQQQNLLQSGLDKANTDALVAYNSDDQDGFNNAISRIDLLTKALVDAKINASQLITETAKSADAAAKTADIAGQSALDKALSQIKQKYQQVADATGTPFDQANFDKESAATKLTLASSKAQGTTEAQIASLTAENKAFQDTLDTMGPKTDENATKFDIFTAAIKANGDTIDALNKKLEGTRSAYDKQVDAVDSQIKEQESLIVAYSGTYDEVQKYIAQQEAEKQVIHDGIGPETDDYAQKVDNLANKHIKLQQVKAQADNAKEIRDVDQQTAAQDRVNAAFDGTAKSISSAESQQKAYLDTINKGVSPTSANFSSEVNKLADAYDKSKASTLAFQQAQSSVNALAQIGTTAFDSLGNALVQAFVSGQSGAINFGNIFKGIMASVLEGLAKLAILNPILNSIGIGTQQPTLLTAFTTLANGAGIQTGGLAGLSSVPGNGGSSSGLLGNISSLYTVGKDLFTSGSAEGGVSGAINSFATAHLPGLFSTPVDTAVTQASLMAGEPVALSGAGTGSTVAGYLPFTASQALGAIGGVSAGYGVGSFAGGLEQSALNKSGPGPQIGAGIGAAGLVAAAALAPETFGLSLIAAGLIGGTAGGLAGGLIGPHPQTSYSSTGLDTANGLFSVGSSVYQQDANAGAEIADTNAKVTALNAILTSHSLSVNSGHIQIGDNNPNGTPDASKYASVDAALAAGVYQFKSTDPDLSNVLSKKTDNFASVADFQTWITNFDAAQTAAKSFITNTTSLLKNFGNVNGSLNDSLASITQQFTDTYTAAEQLKNSGYLSDQQMNDLTTAENNLTAARDKATDAAYKAALQQTQTLNQGFVDRYNTANAANSDNPAIQEAAALSAFDSGAQQQRDQLTQQLTGLYGTAYLSTAGYANEMLYLENALGAERLSIIKNYNDQIAANDNAAKTAAQQAAAAAAQAAAATKLAAQQAADAITATGVGLINNVTNYAHNLRTSQLSPLSPTDQYALNSSTFQQDAALAAAGNAAAIGRISNESDAFLNSSRAVNGSGFQYAADFQQVLDALSQISEVQPDTLTASIAAAQTATQTQTLVAALAELQAELVAIKTQLQSNASTPGRLAA